MKKLQPTQDLASNTLCIQIRTVLVNMDDSHLCGRAIGIQVLLQSEELLQYVNRHVLCFRSASIQDTDDQLDAFSFVYGASSSSVVSTFLPFVHVLLLPQTVSSLITL